MALSLKNKTGVQAIDVNDVIYEMFLEAGYEQCLDESTTLEDYTEVDFKRMTKELGYSETLEAIEEQKDEEYSDDESTEEEPEAEPEEAVEDEVEEEEAEESEKEVKDKEDAIKNMKDVEDVIDMITQELSDEEEDSE